MATIRRFKGLVALLVLAALLAGCEKQEVSAPGENAAEVYAGGATTVFITGSSAFRSPAPNLGAGSLEKPLDGDRQFEQTFVTAPAVQNPGLGPFFNNTSCAGCHPGDGRGRPPEAGEELSAMLIRISSPGADAHGGPNPVPGFGGQLQQRAIVGREPEGAVTTQWLESQGSYPDGSTYTLRKPLFLISGRVPSAIMTSPRIAQPVFGLGLLEAVDEGDILALADEFDVTRDSISGRPNYVWDDTERRMRVGRFGWKAGQPSLLQQTAAAYNEDMGVTNPVFPLESCTGRGDCDTLGDDPEITAHVLEAVVFYVQTLGVPARRNHSNLTVLRGKGEFQSAGCMSCHVEQLRTGVHPSVPAVSRQTIFPYTDLLLHDMGPELADNRPDFRATGREWRTQPLWGIGLTLVVNGHTNFLHDGRARNLEEAILWHGGEAEGARERFKQMPRADREALLLFLQSL
jgi:CxxC motif-containing protein (DUF1111 family)